MNLLQLLILLGAVVFSSQDHLPVCQPPTPSSSESYQETLMIFVLDNSIWEGYKKYHWYFLKTLACSVPVSPSIRTFVVDCSSYNTNMVINKDTVYDSNALMSKLYDGYETPTDATDRCVHFRSTVQALLANQYIKNHPNLHMIVPYLDYTCKLPDFGNTRVLFIDLLEKQDGTRRFLTIGGDGKINADEKFAPKDLVKTTDKLVDHMLHSNEEPVDQCPASKCSESDGCMMKWLIGIGTVVISFVYLAIIVIWVRN